MRFLLFIVCSLTATCIATIPRPRGVPLSKASFYKPDKVFRCIDGSKEIPFEYVNDDFCDCPDGTDEPGTSACPSGKFHCTNAGYKPLTMPSSRVNDGICDCCDGTDEYSGQIECVNNCKELGKQMRAEEEKIKQLQEEGFKMKLKFMEEGKMTREQKKAELEEFEKNKVELEAVKQEMEELKNEAETPEKEAKEKHEQAWNDEVERRKAEKEKLRAQIVFAELDTDENKKINLEEIKKIQTFDVDSDGEVSDDEAREHLEGVDEADLDHFILKVWPNIKQLYTKEGTKGDEQQPSTETPPGDRSDIADDDKDEYDDEDEDDDEGEKKEENAEESKEEEEEKMPDYDEDTKALIAAADEARQKFTDAETKLRETENKIRDLQSYLNIDYGPNEEYSVLKGNCYEYTDREYTYKLCAFERATQRPKSGGSETTLGNWGKWDGPAEDKYAAQKYENGQSCWNGPNRSVRVTFKCGIEHKVTSASEPSRCEYAFDFETPSRCEHVPSKTAGDYHDEL